MKKLFTSILFLTAVTTMFGQLIINEVLYDPSNSGLDGDANGDGVYDQEDDSFIEFVNIGATNFDASGYQIWDDTTSGQLRYVIPANTLVPPNGALVVFGGGTLTGTFGGAIVLKTDSTSGMSLNNSGEVIVIKNNTGNTVLTFDSDALSNNPNESYTRFPDVTGAFIQHGDTTNLLFSPGLRADSTAFDTAYVVSDIFVQGQGGATSIATTGGTLQMEAIVTPIFAADTTVTWSLVAGGSFANISSSGLLTATNNGVVTVKATANDGSAVADSIDITITNNAPVILVTSLLVQGQGGATVISLPMSTLQMEAIVTPTNATDTTVSWSLGSGSSLATINASGMLTAMANGVVTVIATTNDAAGISDSVQIMLSNQDVGLEENNFAFAISIYPNPVKDILTLETDVKIEKVKIFTLAGQLVKNSQASNKKISVSELEAGIYILQVYTDKASQAIPFTKK